MPTYATRSQIMDSNVAHYELGMRQFSEGNFAAARETWTAVEDLPATSPLAHFVRGFNFFMDAEYDVAQACWESGLKLSLPSDPTLREIRLVLATVRTLPRPTCMASSTPVPVSGRRRADGG